MSLVLLFGTFAWLIYGCSWLSDLDAKLESSLETRYVGDDSPDVYSRSWNVVQTRSGKCGTTRSTDWTQSTWREGQTPDGETDLDLEIT